MLHALHRAAYPRRLASCVPMRRLATPIEFLRPTAGSSNLLTPTNHFNELAKLSAGAILTEVHRKSIAFNVVPVTDPTWPIFCYVNADLTLLVIPQDILRSRIAA